MDLLEIDNNLNLELLRLSMAPVIFETINRDREYLQKWLPFVNQTRIQADTEMFIKSIIQSTDSDNNKVFAMWFKNEFAGLIGFKDTDYINKKTEVGYWLAESMQGKGIAIRSVSKLIDYAFRNLNLNRIQIRVAVGNKKSAAIPKKLGFNFEGIELDGEFHTNRYLNIEVYSFLKKDWIDSLKSI
jgi:ribosomal-protein-serine acetyltransferase